MNSIEREADRNCELRLTAIDLCRSAAEAANDARHTRARTAALLANIRHARRRSHRRASGLSDAG